MMKSWRGLRWLNIERELRIVNLWRQAERSHEQGSSSRQCLHACRYCSRPCIFQTFSAGRSEMHDRADWHRSTCIGIVRDVDDFCSSHQTVTQYWVLCVCHPLIKQRGIFCLLTFSPSVDSPFLDIREFFLLICSGIRPSAPT